MIFIATIIISRLLEQPALKNIFCIGFYENVNGRPMNVGAKAVVWCVDNTPRYNSALTKSLALSARIIPTSDLAIYVNRVVFMVVLSGTYTAFTDHEIFSRTRLGYVDIFLRRLSFNR